jgi:transposase
MFFTLKKHTMVILKNQPFAPPGQVTSRYIGVDVGSEELVCACPVDEKTYTTNRFPNTEQGILNLLSYLDAAVDHLVVEATGTYNMRLVWLACEANFKVSVISPTQSKGFIKQVLGDTIKNDDRDACNLCLYGQRMLPPVYVPHPPDAQKANQLQRLYSHLIAEKCATSNRLHALSFHPFPDQTVKSVLEDTLTHYEQKIELVRQQMLHMDQDGFDRMVASISTIVGIGEVTATAVVVATNGLATFQTNNQLAKFIGVNPTQEDSGKTVRGNGKIPKKGNRRLRSLLYNCAKSAKRYNPKSKELYDRLRARGKCHKVAMIAVVRQLIRYIFAIAKSETDFDKNYKPNLATA